MKLIYFKIEQAFSSFGQFQFNNMADKFNEEAEQECQKAKQFVATTIGYEDEDWSRCGVLLKG